MWVVWCNEGGANENGRAVGGVISGADGQVNLIGKEGSINQTRVVDAPRHKPK